jgi:hypothetical protein
MKKRVLIIIGLILTTSIYIAGASSISCLNKNIVNEKVNNGKISGLVETQGRCMLVGVPNLKIACGKNLNNFEIEITDENGFFEFFDLTYEQTGTTYFIWILPNQKVIFPKVKTVELNDENIEEDVYFYVIIWNFILTNKVINNFFNQQFKILLVK